MENNLIESIDNLVVAKTAYLEEIGTMIVNWRRSIHPWSFHTINFNLKITRLRHFKALNYKFGPQVLFNIKSIASLNENSHKEHHLQFDATDISCQSVLRRLHWLTHRLWIHGHQPAAMLIQRMLLETSSTTSRTRSHWTVFHWHPLVLLPLRTKPLLRY